MISHDVEKKGEVVSFAHEICMDCRKIYGVNCEPHLNNEISIKHGSELLECTKKVKI